MYDLSNIVIGNAAGVVKTEWDARKLLESAATRITVGSITVDRRAGNIGETYYYHPRLKTAWNALGLPNPGMGDTLAWLPRFQEKCREAKQELCVSIAGFSPTEYVFLASQLRNVVDRVEINAGCGNVWDHGIQKMIPSYHPELLKTILDGVDRTLHNSSTALSVKISPLWGTHELSRTLESIAKVIRISSYVDEVIAANTYINQTGIRIDGKYALAFREEEGGKLKHTGGMSGDQLRPKSLAVVQALAGLLPHNIRIVGCGGISTGAHVLEYLRAGARGFEIATAYLECGGAKIFSTVLEEATQLQG